MASSSDENQENNSPDAQDSSAGVAKSLLEGNGYKVIKKIGNGSYSKVKVILFFL
jgi:hypothetical protein